MFLGVLEVLVFISKFIFRACRGFDEWMDGSMIRGSYHWIIELLNHSPQFPAGSFLFLFMSYSFIFLLRVSYQLIFSHKVSCSSIAIYAHPG